MGTSARNGLCRGVKISWGQIAKVLFLKKLDLKYILPRKETIVALTSMPLCEGKKQNTESVRCHY